MENHENGYCGREHNISLLYTHTVHIHMHTKVHIQPNAKHDKHLNMHASRILCAFVVAELKKKNEIGNTQGNKIM